MWQFEESLARFLEGTERTHIEMLFAALLPGGPNAPGAIDVGAVDYVDRLLARDETVTYREITTWRKLYRTGLILLNTCAVDRFGRPIDRLDSAECTHLLDLLSRGELSDFVGDVDQRTFFHTLRAHCIEGCFADPRWGGNKDGAMWQWFGYLQEPMKWR